MASFLVPNWTKATPRFDLVLRSWSTARERERERDIRLLKTHAKHKKELTSAFNNIPVLREEFDYILLFEVLGQVRHVKLAVADIVSRGSRYTNLDPLITDHEAILKLNSIQGVGDLKKFDETKAKTLSCDSILDDFAHAYLTMLGEKVLKANLHET